MTDNRGWFEKCFDKFFNVQIDKRYTMSGFSLSGEKLTWTADGIPDFKGYHSPQWMMQRSIKIENVQSIKELEAQMTIDEMSKDDPNTEQAFL